DHTVAIARRYTNHILTAPRSGASVGATCSAVEKTDPSDPSNPPNPSDPSDPPTPNAQRPTPNAQPPTPNAPGPANFDAARNLALPHATGDWIFYLDADERVPPRLGEALR